MKTMIGTIIPVVLAAALALGGCASSQKRSDSQMAQQKHQQPQQVKDQQAQQQAQQPPQSLQAQQQAQPFVQESIQVPGVGEPNTSQSQASVPVTTVTTRTTQTQLPVVSYQEQKADINRMTADNFVAMGFSQDQAQRIVATRSAMPGGFTSVSGLRQVPGIDQALVVRLTPKLGTSAAPVQQAGQAYLPQPNAPQSSAPMNEPQPQALPPAQ